MVYEPVCGTDDLTYMSRCDLERTACLVNDSTIQVAYSSECQSAVPLTGNITYVNIQCKHVELAHNCWLKENAIPRGVTRVCGARGKNKLAPLIFLFTYFCQKADP